MPSFISTEDILQVQVHDPVLAQGTYTSNWPGLTKQEHIPSQHCLPWILLAS